MMKHTAEPWKCIRTRDGTTFIVDENDNTVACFGLGNQAYENARRIVACVNAYAGIPTERLEDPETDQAKLTKKLFAEWKQLEAQRDELLAALKELASGGDNVCGFEIPCTCRFCRARALIAKIEAQS